MGLGEGGQQKCALGREWLLGRRPGTFEAWCVRNADAFRRAAAAG
ncbi:hypothetical protein ACFVUN_00105 [Kitasatospora griseola]